MSTWKAVYVEQDTPTETEGWYVVGFADTSNPVVLKVEGTEIDGEHQAVAERVAAILSRASRNEVTVHVGPDTPAIRRYIEGTLDEIRRLARTDPRSR